MPVIDKIIPDDLLPQRADVVIIGAGIIGICTALELTERGLSVVVVEKGEVAAEQSSRNWGWCRQMGRDAREIPLIKESLQLWGTMNARVGAETGYRRSGILYLEENERQRASHEKWVREIAVPHGLDTRLIGADQVAQMAPGASRKYLGGMYTAGDGRAEPFIAVPAMAHALQRLGGQVFTNCAARGLETTAGSVSAVVTERGVIRCSQVVLAGGNWSRRFLHNVGISFPQLSVVGSVMRTAPLDVGIATIIAGGKFTARKRLDGGFTVTHNYYSTADIMPDSFRLLREFLPVFKLDWRNIRLRLGKRFIEEAKLARRWTLDQVSPFEQVRILDAEPVSWILDEAAADLKKAFPAFATMQIAEKWGGVIDVTPDAVPVISSVATRSGLFLASGFSGHGFGLGPGAGKLMAQIVVGEKPCVDPAPFRFDRFGEGRKPQPAAGL
jgi:glycine/D-amino acid oxidase-like deaminating enzyme